MHETNQERPIMSYFPIRSEIAQTFKATRHANTALSSKRISKITGPPRRGHSKARRNERVIVSQGTSDSWPIIVHCHLCWDWVWQRPQQFISRLSRRHKILFVETVAPAPDLARPLARYRTAQNFPNVTILTLQFPSWRWGDGKYVDGERKRIVQEFIAGPVAGQFEDPVQWFYDPMA